MAVQKEKYNRRKVSGTLSCVFKGKIAFVGVGNVFRGDDAFGPALIEKLRESTRAVCINAGEAPENYLGKIIKAKPDTIIIVDAAELGRGAGECELLKKEDIIRTGFTTHDLSPAMFIEYLEKETKADIYVLAVQPECVSFGAEMSGNVRETLEEVAALIKETIYA